MKWRGKHFLTILRRFGVFLQTRFAGWFFLLTVLGHKWVRPAHGESSWPLRMPAAGLCASQWLACGWASGWLLGQASGWQPEPVVASGASSSSLASGGQWVCGAKDSLRPKQVLEVNFMIVCGVR